MAPQLDGRSAEAGFAQAPTSPEDVEAYVEEALQMLVDQIADEELLAIARLKLECYTTDEIAEQTGLSEHQVRRRLSQIRALLAKREGDDG